MANEGYWVTPHNELVEVNTTHINEILNNSEKFGFAKEELQDIYKRHDEPWGMEGHAREEIMKRVIQHGWVRVRHLGRSDMFTIQISRLGDRQRDQIQSFAMEVMTKSKNLQYSDIKILNLEGHILGQYSLKALAHDALYKDKVASGLKRIRIADYKPTQKEVESLLMSKVLFCN